MEYLGERKIVHRDLAARNILVASDSHVKISDFGLAQVTGANTYYYLKTNRELPFRWCVPGSQRRRSGDRVGLRGMLSRLWWWSYVWPWGSLTCRLSGGVGWERCVTFCADDVCLECDCEELSAD